MGIKQQRVGKSWEQELLNYYSKRGYWSYKFPTDFNGTVCDIMIVKDSGCMFIEAKHITKDKLYYKSSGIYKKKDELDNFVKKYNCNIYIMIKSDILGVYWTTWVIAKEIFERKGYLDLKEDCVNANIRE